MNNTQPWEFTCKACGGHKLNVTRVWKIPTGPYRRAAEWKRERWRVENEPFFEDE